MKTFIPTMLSMIVAVATITLSEMAAGQAGEDDSLVLHYRFDQDPGDLAKDHSRYGNDASIVNAEYLELDVDGLFKGYVGMIEQAIGRDLSWAGDDIALQNIQARVRAPAIKLSSANTRGSKTPTRGVRLGPV